MIVSQLRTADLPKQDRFSYWYELAASAHVPMLIDTEDRTDFDATIQLYDLGPMQLSRLTYPALAVRRPARLIRRFDPELLHVSLTTQGAVCLSQLGREQAVSAGSLVVYDTSQPCFVVNRAPVTQLVLQLPRSMLGFRARDADPMLARPIAADRGIGGMLAHILTDVGTDGAAYPLAVAPRLATAMADLILALHAVARGDGAAVPDESRGRILRARIHEFIRRHLGDPALSPAVVAAAHQISIRQLNRIMQSEGVTVSGLIREQRLERCRRELVGPVQSSRSVQSIGARWGFPDPASFSRVFRREYGMPPGDYRRRFAGPPNVSHGPSPVS